MIANNDLLYCNVEEQIMHEHERNLLKFCSLFTNQLKILASIENSFQTIYDFIRVSDRIILASNKWALVKVGNNIKEFKLNNILNLIISISRV
ncbi:hypothetical protein BpHYR1_040499 [Brachionus plicatilis]|uniref:Uncharacterized protein n=1 Tax=Brachionus plicatilis TaxID=10195 RepID=A0A3M7RJ69_BRAPC|nr:hypothetical protein BpHYR1_040499 [Brachionus plicatilis]